MKSSLKNKLGSGLKRLPWLGYFCFFLLCQTPLPGNTSPELADRVYRSTVKITGLNHGQRNLGSGVVIGQRGNTYSVLTCNHVVDHGDSTEYSVTTGDYQNHDVNVSSIEAINDLNLAIFSFRSEVFYPAIQPKRFSFPSVGFGIFLSGYAISLTEPQDSNFRFTPGSIAGLLDPPYPGGYGFVHTASSAQGMGGSPVVDSSGDLIGIHCGVERTESPSPLGLAIPAQSLFEDTDVIERLGLDSS